MKNYVFPAQDEFKLRLIKYLIIVKFVVSFILVCFFQAKARDGHAQTVSLYKHNVSIIEVFREIKKQTNYSVIGDSKLIKGTPLISIEAKDVRLEDALDQLLTPVGLDYVVERNSIVIVRAVQPMDAKKLADETSFIDQQKVVSGKVTDEDGEALVGVSIRVIEEGDEQKHSLGAVTDENGFYSVDVPVGAAALVFSFMGYLSEEAIIGDRTIINVVLKPSVADLEEVVVVGYGTREKDKLSGSISTVSAQQIGNSTETNVMGRVQGQISGVTVTNANTPGGAPAINIRGLGTINDASPLYIIDGVPADPSNSLNSNDIESISVLKDASSAAIYGTRGANGVVIITTKRGREGQLPGISVSMRTGASRAANRYDLLNTEQYGEVLWMTARNQGLTPGVDWSHPHYGNGSEPRIPDYILPVGAMEGDPGTDPEAYSYDPYQAIIRASKEGTDWYDAIYQTGLVQEYNVSVAGGGNNGTYALSGGYLNEEGYLKYTGFDRFTFRSNSDARIARRFKVGQSLQASLGRPKGVLDNNGEYTPIANAYKLQPIIPVYDIMGNFAGSRPVMMGESHNPLSQLVRARDNQNNEVRLLGNFFAEVDIIEGLTFRSLLGYSYNQWNNLSRTFPNPERSVPQLTPIVNKASNYTFQWNWANTLDYNTTIAGIHHLNFTVGTEAIENKYDWLTASRDTYFSLDPDYMQLGAGTGQQLNDGTATEWSLFSMFGRVNYSLGDNYIIEGTFRRDGSSRFGPNHRYANFIAASGAWVISEERFMEGTRHWLDFLKLRLGWGMSGNDRIGNYNYYSTYGTHLAHSAYDITGANTSAVVGFQPVYLGNPDVGWETTETWNLGLDFRALGNSLSFAADVWQRNTTDMLFRKGIPDVMGAVTAPFVNIGDMKNTGVDLEVGYRKQINESFRYGITATLSTYRNRVVKLSDNAGEQVILGDYRNVTYARAEAGRAFPEFYGYIVDGIFSSQADADAHAPAFGEEGDYNKAGRYKYRDVTGDGVVDNEDMTYIGNPHPDFTGGLNLDLGYGSFDLNLFFYGSYGNDMINLVRRNIDFGMFEGNYSPDVLYRSWGSPYLTDNADAVLPIHDLSDGSIQPSSAFVEDGSFLRLKHVRVGYNFPQKMTGNALKRLRIYGQATNLFTMTNYSGLDPELSAASDRRGLDLGAWPTPRQFIIGLEIGL